MKLFIHGIEHDSSREIEIFNHDKGFNVIIKYKDDLSDMRNYEAFFNTREGEEISLCNVTEFHHLYRPGHTAFESNIHSTGHTFDEEFLSAFESIFVVSADVVEEDFYSDWLTPDLKTN
jgi:hypothetical protein